MNFEPQNAFTKVATFFVEQLNHCQALGVQCDGANANHVKLSLPYQQKLVGNPDTGHLHGGVLTSLIDSACGAAVLVAQYHHKGIWAIAPTMDLRIDYMTAAKPGSKVYVIAQCYRITDDVAFTRAVAYQDNIDRPVAHVTASFMLVQAGFLVDSFAQTVQEHFDGI
ncbi:PaaI family thioesterase [Paraferrimonas sp. SM1919]|uniref:PaaI family thioesterase n=1 Tax=Paraferrimonas sp. SM1919 TaxID=2662263 RepID=UPI0013D4BD61|nr:PaaI family thioesterase [Paraferrimonas sp. SM1919]